MERLSNLQISTEVVNRAITNPQIPDHVIIHNVLLKFPIKFLLRLKCVSRAWCDLISSPDFMQIYNSYSRASPNGCYMLHYDIYNDPHIFIKNMGGDVLSKIFLVKSDNVFSNICNGLVCLYNGSENQALVLNLTTQEKKILPRMRYHRFRLNLGFDPVAKKYKVVYFDRAQCKILTLETGKNNSWRTVECPSKGLLPHIVGQWSAEDSSIPVHVQGCLYWIPTKKREVAYLDLAAEKFGTIPLPKGLEGQNLKWCARIEYSGKLTIARALKHGDIMLELWIYDSDTMVWSAELLEPLVRADFVVINAPCSTEIFLKTKSHLFHCDEKTRECQQIPIDASLYCRTLNKLHSGTTVFLGIVDVNLSSLGLLFQ